MRTRLWRRITLIAFLGFFALYVTAAIVWLLVGLAPAVVRLSPSLHDSLHGWGGGERVIYLEVSEWSGRFEQRKAWAPWASETGELTFNAGAEAVVYFQNNERAQPHNLSIYTDSTATVPIFQGQVVRGPSTDDQNLPPVVYRFTAPSAGIYFFRSDLDPTINGVVRVTDARRGLDSPPLAEIARDIAQATHISEPLPLVAFQYLFSVVNLGLGVVLVRLRPRDPAARLLALGMVGTGAVFNIQSHSVEYLTPLVRQIHEAFHVVAGVAYAGALLIFPDGKLFPQWSMARWFRWPMSVFYLLLFAFVGFTFGSTIHGDPGSFVAFFGVVIPIMGITSQAVRSRRAQSAEERQQSRVMAWGLALPFGMTLLFGISILIIYGASGFGPGGQPIEGLKRVVFLIFPPLFAVIPLALFVMMLRYRLWEIDRVINRALVYGLLTGVLAVTYLVSVVVLGAVLTLVVGPRANSFVVAVSTLVVAAIFGPARRWLQSLIDRRFDRAKYDAAQTLAAFGSLIGDEVDLQRLNADLLSAVERTLHPSHVCLWLRSSEEDDNPLRQKR